MARKKVSSWPSPSGQRPFESTILTVGVLQPLSQVPTTRVTAKSRGEPMLLK